MLLRTRILGYPELDLEVDITEGTTFNSIKKKLKDEFFINSDRMVFFYNGNAIDHSDKLTSAVFGQSPIISTFNCAIFPEKSFPTVGNAFSGFKPMFNEFFVPPPEEKLTERKRIRYAALEQFMLNTFGRNIEIVFDNDSIPFDLHDGIFIPEEPYTPPDLSMFQDMYEEEEYQINDEMDNIGFDLSPEEETDISALIQDTNMNRMMVMQYYFACDRNRELTYNSIMSSLE